MAPFTCKETFSEFSTLRQNKILIKELCTLIPVYSIFFSNGALNRNIEHSMDSIANDISNAPAIKRVWYYKADEKSNKGHKTDKMEKFIRPTTNRRRKIQKDHNTDGRLAKRKQKEYF